MYRNKIINFGGDDGGYDGGDDGGDDGGYDSGYDGGDDGGYDGGNENDGGGSGPSGGDDDDSSGGNEDDDDNDDDLAHNDDESNDNDSDEDQNSEVALYDGSPVSCDEFRSTLLALQQKHNFSSAATNSILKLFQITLPTGNKCPSSNYKLETEFSELSYSFKKTFTCLKCQHILDEDSLCTNTECCKYENDGLGENSSVFYIINLVEEIKVFISGE